MSPTFGERISSLEEKIEQVSVILDILLQCMGLMDAEGNWVESDEPAARDTD